jgi:hypothetical protein
MSVSLPSTEVSPLAQKVLDCFASGSYALPTLLRLVSITESHEVTTAAVECKDEPRLLLNPDFVDAWADTPEKLFMLVMHELHHVLLGHTRLFEAVDEMDNLVFDAVINALLCHMFPQRQFTEFLVDFYDDRQFPACLLRPPAGWRPDIEFELPPVLQESRYKKAATVYQQLYSRSGASYVDLYEALREEMADSQAEEVQLLGDHSDPEAKTEILRDQSPMIAGVVAEAVHDWPRDKNRGPGRSIHGLLEMETVETCRRPSNRALLRALIRCVGGNSRVAGTSPQFTEAVISVTSPVAKPDRRSIVLGALGRPSCLYAQDLMVRRWNRAHHQVHIYLDVSGSVDAIKGSLYGAVLDCRSDVHPKVHLFSTEVADISLRELREGKCITTGGTDIACIVDHIARHRVKRAIIITDGCVGCPSKAQAQVLRKTILGIAFTPGWCCRDDLDDLSRSSIQLE